MREEIFESRLANWQRTAARLNERLEPIVHRQVDINMPDWEEQLAAAPHPADQLGIRGEVEALFEEIIAALDSMSPQQRQATIDTVACNDALSYAACLKAEPDKAAEFRRHMLLFVLRDQAKDTRDAIIELRHCRLWGQDLGVDVDAVFRELAELASTRDRHGWGSTRELLLKN